MSLFVRKQILGVPIASLTLKEIKNVALSLIEAKGKKSFFYVNAHCLNIAQKDKEYKNILKNATFVYSGGIGPIIASKILGKPLSQRTPTPDFIEKIFCLAQEKNWSLYFLGSKENILKKMAEKLKFNHPNLNIAGFHHGYFSKEEEKELIKEINEKKPVILLVGMGSPKQEKWIAQNLTRVNAKVFWAVGALFDILSGEIPRAPLLMRNLGLEWLYRFLKEPRRLWKRYLLGNVSFLKYVLTQRKE